VAVSFNGLSEDTEELMQLFGEVIQQPAFPQDKLELRRSQLLDRLAHKNDDLGAIPRRELAKVRAHGRSACLHDAPSGALSSMRIDRPSSRLNVVQLLISNPNRQLGVRTPPHARAERRALPRKTASKTDVTILSLPHNASSAPWSSTPSLHSSISLAVSH